MTGLRDALILESLAVEDWWTERIAPRLEWSDGCLVFTGGIDRSGYGRAQLPYRFRLPGKRYSPTVLLHRVAYLREHGSIPDETLDHLCRRRACVLVTHLEPVANAENTARGENISTRHRRKTECPKCGGPLTPRTGTPQWRRCVPCHKAANLAWWHAVGKHRKRGD